MGNQLKSQGGISSLLSSHPTSRHLPSKLDLEGTLVWIESLNALIEKITDSQRDDAVSESGLSQTEVEMLEEERELIGQQLAALRGELNKVCFF